jgi:hypothetical protein
MLSDDISGITCVILPQVAWQQARRTALGQKMRRMRARPACAVARKAVRQRLTGLASSPPGGGGATSARAAAGSVRRGSEPGGVVGGRHDHRHPVVQVAQTKVRAVVEPAGRTGRGYIAVRVGRVLLYLEDRAALDALTGAVRAAGGHADAVYGEPQDAFSLTEARARRNFEKGRRPRP